jgi:hypothetical protein
MRNVVKKKSSPKSARLRKPDFVLWRSKSSKAKFRSKRKSAGNKLPSAMLRRKKPGLPLSVRKLKRHVSVSVNFSYS